MGQILSVALAVTAAAFALGGGEWDVYRVGKFVIIIVAIVAVVCVVCKVAGFVPPWWLVQILIIVAVAAVAILALGFLISL